MSAIYKSSGTKASVSQILVLACVVILIPTMVLAVLTYMATAKEAAVHLQYFRGDDINQALRDQQPLVKFGRYLRENSFPFTQPDPYNGRRHEHQPLEIWMENLHDAQAAIAYIWVIVLLIACSSFGFLAINVHRAFQRLSTALNLLNTDHTNQQIRVDGPADIRDLSIGLENLRVKIKDGERVQQRFLRHISHEIKTPLTSIKEGSKLLDEQMIGAMNEEQQEIAKILVKSSNELQSAIENLLDYNAVVASSGEKKFERTNLKELVVRALEKHELALRNKQIVVKTELDEPISRVDSAQILSVFDNLISNAIKYSPEAGIINIWLKAKKGNKVGFIIKDQGPGVHASQENQVFEPFFVGEHSRKLPLRGTGLGLSIAKQYVLDHSGEIKLLKSRRGAAFQVTLPYLPSV